MFMHVAYGTDYFKLRALTLLEDTISERLKKGRGEQVVFTTVGKPIWRFGAFVARNSQALAKRSSWNSRLLASPGTNPCKMHRNIPVKLPLRSNLTPLATITYLDLAILNSGRWTCLPQVAHTTLNPSIEMNVEMLSTLHVVVILL